MVEAAAQIEQSRDLRRSMLSRCRLPFQRVLNASGWTSVADGSAESFASTAWHAGCYITGMAKSRRKETRTPEAPADSRPSDMDRDRVAMRAYELYLERGAADGQDMEDWLIAERELRGSREKPGDES